MQKWRFAIGTTSRVPRSYDPLTSEHLHYLILDIDGKLNPLRWQKLVRLCPHAILEKTRNGFHVYTDIRVHSSEFIRLARRFGADPVWINIGHKRGYWFLAERYRPINPPWNVERMTLNAA